jgi:hypothetical protein
MCHQNVNTLSIGAQTGPLLGRDRRSKGTEAVFQVAPSYMKNMEADKELELQSNSQYREFVNHLSTTVTRQDVLARAGHAEGQV